MSTSIEQFQSRLSDYYVVSGKDTETILGQKGRDLGIRLFKGYYDHKFGGSGKPLKGLARRQLDERSRRGSGIKVRQSLLDQYAQARITLAKERVGIAGFIGPRTKAGAALARRQFKANLRRRSQLWRRTVGLELARRQSGIGALAASFLWYRKYTTKESGTRLVANRSGRPIGGVTRTPDSLRIQAQSPGISTLDKRHSIVDKALQGAADDMLTYLRRKARERAQRLTS